MKSIFLLLIVLMIAINVSFAQQAILKPTSFKEDIEKLMLEKNVPAVGIAIIENGELCEIQVYGELKKGTSAPDSKTLSSPWSLTNNTPAPDNAIFNIASLSKPISAILVLTLVSNGDWDLDEPLYHYWVDPDIKDDPYLKKLTTRIVLTQQTGFDNWRWMNESKKLTFNFEPGTQVKYSGEGFEYLRLAIEHNKEGVPYNYKKRIINASASDRVLTTIGDYGLFAVNVMKGAGLTEEVYNDMIRPQAIVSSLIE